LAAVALVAAVSARLLVAQPRQRQLLLPLAGP